MIMNDTSTLDVAPRVQGDASDAPQCECLSAELLARFLGVNRKTVYEYAAKNVIPHPRLGRRIVFSPVRRTRMDTDAIASSS